MRRLWVASGPAHLGCNGAGLFAAQTQPELRCRKQHAKQQATRSRHCWRHGMLLRREWHMHRGHWRRQRRNRLHRGRCKFRPRDIIISQKTSRRDRRQQEKKGNAAIGRQTQTSAADLEQGIHDEGTFQSIPRAHTQSKLHTISIHPKHSLLISFTSSTNGGRTGCRYLCTGEPHE